MPRVRNLMCENDRFKVFFDDIETDRGRSVKNYLVVTPKVTHHAITGVAILPIRAGEIGLLKIYRHAIEDYSWEVPRGFIDVGESPAISAARELVEETGLVCTADNLLPLGVAAPDAGILCAKVQLFAALNCSPTTQPKHDELGHCELAFFSSEAIDRMITASQIQDPSTLISYFKYKNQLY